jgi:hypothetical protein
VAITVAAIAPDTPPIGPAILATALGILAMAVLPAIVLRLQPFQVRAIARAIVLPLQLFLQIRAIARIPQVALPVPGQVGERRALCRPLQGTVRTRPRVIDPARMKHAVISVHRPPTLAPGNPLVQMHFPDPAGGARRALAGTKVWQPKVAGEVANGGNSYETRVESFRFGTFKLVR